MLYLNEICPPKVKHRILEDIGCSEDSITIIKEGDFHETEHFYKITSSANTSWFLTVITTKEGFYLAFNVKPYSNEMHKRCFGRRSYKLSASTEVPWKIAAIVCDIIGSYEKAEEVLSEISFKAKNVSEKQSLALRKNNLSRVKIAIREILGDQISKTVDLDSLSAQKVQCIANFLYSK